MADNKEFSININIDEVAQKLGQVADTIAPQIQKSVENLSAATHAKIVTIVNEAFPEDEFKRQFYLGQGKYAKTNLKSDEHPLVLPDSKNLRWNKLSNNLWVVELDPSAEWLEMGRDRVSMATEDWLLKPGPSLKHAKDGSTYKSIPMPAGKQASHSKSDKGEAFLKDALMQSIEKAGIDLKTIQMDNAGNPKLGITDKIDTSDFEWQGSSIAGAFSRGRTAEESAATGLPEHEGHFMIGGAVMLQREDPDVKGGVRRDAVVFRTVSSKHLGEDRWMAPAVPGIHAFEQAERWANDQWNAIVKQMDDQFNKVLG
jgi:hypothetical protein